MKRLRIVSLIAAGVGMALVALLLVLSPKRSDRISGTPSRFDEQALKLVGSTPGSVASGEAGTPGARGATSESDDVPAAASMRFVVSEETSGLHPSSALDHVMREWKGQFSPNLRSIGAVVIGQSITLDLPDRSYAMRVDSVTRNGDRSGVVMGSIIGSAYSEVAFSYVNRSMAGSVRMPASNTVYEIRNAGNGQQYIATVDVSKLGECGVEGDQVASVAEGAQR